MDQRIINLFDEYTHKPLKRDEFISRLVRLTGSMAAAMSVLPLLEVNYAKAATVPEDTNDLNAEDITYPGDRTSMKAYLVKPAGQEAKKGAVIVIHENRGLNPHIRDVARRVAQAGYIALAPDALSVFGGTPQDEEAARDLFGKLDTQQNLNNFLKAVDYLQSLPESNGKIGCVGFCWGGAMANQLAVNAPSLKAAVAYYGKQPDAADVPKIKAAVLLHYGGLDERINAGIPAYEAALKAAGVKYELFVYQGAQHAFNNDTAPTRYNKEAATLAWQRTLKLFQDTLH
ncbi:dienelactone hydrolase family protein [Chitinophaga pendula]|uniref:dienelactone hydrolase family protein n=1 Tax=Chitinophaga TaxID=79328 RepID=UPI000BB01E3F|nr:MULTISPECIES: dienelactone hydrolase family protein [Chitinophaga]ASZ13319.1 carboxymethylenebutenolidase [Chitinophaga sp. MD30]UCJ09056.1 dienelactone hydrolase family protein [Chitinophaga pendula]